MVILYNLGIRLYNFAVYLVSFFNPKAKLWIEGRKKIFTDLPDFSSRKVIWVHCASLGEFEQGRPIIEGLKSQYADYKIILTFFSPSGYEVRKNYPLADHICYLPNDTKPNASKFIDYIKPSFVIFIKYEFWYHYFNELNQRKIPLYIVSAIFRPQQIFFQWYGVFFRKILKLTTHFFLQNDQSKDLLNSLGLKNFSISGDTRFDRVLSISHSIKPFPEVEAFKKGSKLLIAGSTWQADEKLLINAFTGHQILTKNIKVIIAPHEISKEKIEHLCDLLKDWKPVKFSELNSQNGTENNILIIDNIGMLSMLYQYADYVFIGGGFGKGIHNVLEAAVFTAPIFFGPNYEKFEEATDLINLGLAFPIQNSFEMIGKINFMEEHPDELNKIKTRTSEYVKNKAGATKIILNYLSNKHR